MLEKGQEDLKRGQDQTEDVIKSINSKLDAALENDARGLEVLRDLRDDGLLRVPQCRMLRPLPSGQKQPTLESLRRTWPTADRCGCPSPWCRALRPAAVLAAVRARGLGPQRGVKGVQAVQASAPAGVELVRCYVWRMVWCPLVRVLARMGVLKVTCLPCVLAFIYILNSLFTI